LTRSEFYKGYFDIIFVFSNTAGEGADDLYDHLKVPEENIFKPDKAGLQQLRHIIQTNKKIVKKSGIEHSPKILVVFDDIANERKFLASDEYLKLHIMNRHYNISLFSLTQSYMKLPRSCRMQISALFYFKGKQTESERISDEHCPEGYHAKEFLQMIQHATHKPYEFLYINYKAPRRQQYRRCLHTIMELRE
jgi:Leucine-rich repeat (LRR) protein